MTETAHPGYSAVAKLQAWLLVKVVHQRATDDANAAGVGLPPAGAPATIDGGVMTGVLRGTSE